MNWSIVHRRESQNTQKRLPNVVFAYTPDSFFTSRPRFLLFILIWESLNPPASSKTDSKEQNSLTIIVHISQNWMLGIKFMIKNSSSDVKILRRWIKELFPTSLTLYSTIQTVTICQVSK